MEETHHRSRAGGLSPKTWPGKRGGYLLILQVFENGSPSYRVGFFPYICFPLLIIRDTALIVS